VPSGRLLWPHFEQIARSADFKDGTMPPPPFSGSDPDQPQFSLANGAVNDAAASFGSAATAPTATPEFSIIIPLPDDRGALVEAVASWRQRQTYPREQFELVLVSQSPSLQTSLENSLRSLLAAQDRILVATADTITPLYAAGAAAARRPWLLFTESHCIAEPACLAELARYLSTHPVDGALLRSVPIAANWVGRLEADRFQARLAAGAEWARTVAHGYALSRDAYQAVGGLEDGFQRFGEAALAAKLHAQGRRLGYATGAAVHHVYSTRLAQTLSHVIQFAEGSILYRHDCPADFCEEYFGLPTEWRERHLGQPEAARALRRAVGRRLLKPREWRDKGRLLGRWLSYAARAWWGWQPSRWAAALGLRAALLRCWLRRSEAEFDGIHQQALRLGRLQGLVRRVRSMTPLTGLGVHPITALGDDTLIGLSAPGSRDGAPVRWLGPEAAVPLALPPGVYELALETRGRGGAQVASLEATLDGRPVALALGPTPAWLRLRFIIDAGSATAWLVFTTRPRHDAKPSKNGTRPRCIPVFSIRLDKVAHDSTPLPAGMDRELEDGKCLKNRERHLRDVERV
jgi:hypothetical protein